MPFQLPQNADQFSDSALEFWKRISGEKRNSPLAAGDWYPFETLSCLDTVKELIASDYETFAGDIGGYPVAELGCADGDFAMLFASWGAAVDAIDYAPNNSIACRVSLG